MTESFNTAQIKDAASMLGSHVDFVLEPTVLYFSESVPPDAVSPAKDTWTCMFALMKQVQAGRPACFSAAHPGCVGAASYLGFNTVPVVPAAIYLSRKEHLKKDASLAAAFYEGVEPVPAAREYLIFQRLDSAPDSAEAEVVQLWLNAAALSALHTLANYDRAANDNVIMPFGSGCQSIWTMPYKEKLLANPKAVVGSLDPTVRRFLPPDAVSFSVPAHRFVEMCANIRGSFLSAGKNGKADAEQGKPGARGAGSADDDMQVLEPSKFSAKLVNLGAFLKFFK